MTKKAKYELMKGVVGICIGKTIGEVISNNTKPKNVLELTMYAVGCGFITGFIGSKIDQYIDDNLKSIVFKDETETIS